MIEDYFNDKCNIFHLNAEKITSDYGLGTDIQFSYNEAPDIAEQACHFHKKNNNFKLEQGAPDNNIFITRKLSCPVDVDIRVNDKIVDCETGIEYTALQPEIIHKRHHKIVMLTRQYPQSIL